MLGWYGSSKGRILLTGSSASTLSAAVGVGIAGASSPLPKESPSSVACSRGLDGAASRASSMNSSGLPPGKDTAAWSTEPGTWRRRVDCAWGVTCEAGRCHDAGEDNEGDDGAGVACHWKAVMLAMEAVARIYR